MSIHQCCLCGSDILEDIPHESWDRDDKDAWREQNPDASDPADTLGDDEDEPEYIVTLYAHAGCYRLKHLVDASEWDWGDLQELVTEWVDRNDARARQAEAAAEGCAFAATAVRRALRKHCDCRTIATLRSLSDAEAEHWRHNAHFGNRWCASTVWTFRQQVEKAAADGAVWVEFFEGCPEFSPLTGCPGHGYRWEEET